MTMNDCGLMVLASGEKLALRGVDVSARIAGLLAATTLTQRYRNDTDTNLELAYTFPLPVDGTLLSFSVQIGERRYEGKVTPRKAAELAYEQAISGGHSAFRLQEIRPGMYHASLGNVMAGESVAITLSYAETLPWSGRGARYRLPTSIAPRYGVPTGLLPWQQPVTRMEAEYTLGLVVTIVGPLAQSAIACPSHQVSLRSSDEALKVILAAGARLDRDFILEIENEAVQSLGVHAHARDTHVALLTLLPPKVENAQTSRDTVLVIDCSGSMQGDSLTLAREGVKLALNSLSLNERFALVGFGTQFVHFDPTLQPANKQNLMLARSFVDQLGNLGGTELSKALEQAMAYFDERPMDILLLTDGETWNPGSAIIEAQRKGIRIFTVGIGSAVAEDTVRALADQTGGACELVAPTEDMSKRIFRHFQRMRQPQMSCLDIEWPGTPLWEVRPERACFAGDAFTVAAAFASAPVQAAKLSFEFAGQPSTTLTLPLVQEETAADAIVRVAARQRLGLLPDGDRLDWAVKYQLLTDRTDYFIAVTRESDEMAVTLPALQVQPQMLAAGWSGSSSVTGRRCCMKESIVAFRDHLDSEMPAAIRQSSQSANTSSHPMDYGHGELPPVIRRVSRSTNEAMSSDGVFVSAVTFLRLLQELNWRSLGMIFGRFPTTLTDLAKLACPDELRLLVAEATPHHSEAEILLALYEALGQHDGRAFLGEAFLKRLAALKSGATLNAELVARFRALFDVLWRVFNAPNSKFDQLRHTGISEKKC